jgi:hypothetical protein
LVGFGCRQEKQHHRGSDRGAPAACAGLRPWSKRMAGDERRKAKTQRIQGIG